MNAMQTAPRPPHMLSLEQPVVSERQSSESVQGCPTATAVGPWQVLELLHTEVRRRQQHESVNRN
jgi:hypothetical protein